MKKMICVKLEPELLTKLDEIVATKGWLNRNRAIENAIKAYVNFSKGLSFERYIL